MAENDDCGTGCTDEWNDEGPPHWHIGGQSIEIGFVGSVGAFLTQLFAVFAECRLCSPLGVLVPISGLGVRPGGFAATSGDLLGFVLCSKPFSACVENR